MFAKGQGRRGRAKDQGMLRHRNVEFLWGDGVSKGRGRVSKVGQVVGNQGGKRGYRDPGNLDASKADV